MNCLHPPLITVDAIAVRLRDRWLLEGASWQINTGEQWAVVGANGAGKTTLVQAVAGLLPVVQGKIHYHALEGLPPTEAIAYVAGDECRRLWRRERHLDHARNFAGRFNAATTVRQWLDNQPGPRLPTRQRNLRLADLIRELHLERLLEKPLMAISTGEMSRVLLARELVRRPKMLVLDEPFEGLDATGRSELKAVLDRMAAMGLPMVLVVHRPEEMLASTTHLLSLDNGRITAAKPVDRRPAHPIQTTPGTTLTAKAFTPSPTPETQFTTGSTGSETLVEMQSATVRYGDTIILDRITWAVRSGEHWSVTGPNGAGKSTLLKLITGACLQVYANRIRLFGRERGPEQTLGDVRERLGVVSHGLARAYQKQMSAMDVVCSGFFDSVGLYRHCDAGQRKAAVGGMERLGLSALASNAFNQLSQGERQMILIARAMVKRPRLLIMDEPCSGLDPANRGRVLDLVERIGRGGATGLIFVTHHEQEMPPCITHRLELAHGRVAACGPVEVDCSRLKAERVTDEG